MRAVSLGTDPQEQGSAAPGLQENAHTVLHRTDSLQGPVTHPAANLEPLTAPPGSAPALTQPRAGSQQHPGGAQPFPRASPPALPCAEALVTRLQQLLTC